MGLDSDIDTKIVVNESSDATSWMGFGFDIPLGADNEDRGFGICHRIDRETRGIAITNSLRIQVGSAL